MMETYGYKSASRMLYHQKLGISSAITRHIAGNLYNYTPKDGKFQCRITLPASLQEWSKSKFPMFTNKEGCFFPSELNWDGSELSFKFAGFKWKDEQGNRNTTQPLEGFRWHTVREGLTIMQTAILFEVICETPEIRVVPIDNPE